MGNKDFIKFRDEMAKVMRQNENLCREGYLDILRATDINMLCVVVRRHWAELNRTLWKEFQKCLCKFYKVFEAEVNRHGIFYNVVSNAGICCVDKYSGVPELQFWGTADVIAHDDSHLALFGQAHALLLDSSVAIARDNCRVDAHKESLVIAFDSSRVRAFDNAQVTSNGSTEIYLYGFSRLNNIRSRKVESGNHAKIIV